MPPYLAGRQHETDEFRRFLLQDIILENLILTGLRGIGKTVLLENFKPIAIQGGWQWVGTDLSESTSVSEETMAIRLLTDLSVVTAGITVTQRKSPVHFEQGVSTQQAVLTYAKLHEIYAGTPGVPADKLKAVFEFAWAMLSQLNCRGVVFAYDEAQNLADHATKDQYPLSLLLDVFQSIQRKNIPFMLALTGLPTLFPRLVEARTYSERMFHIITLKPLTKPDTREAVTVPIKNSGCPFTLDDTSIETIWSITRGYPYFVQFVCRAAYDIWVQDVLADRPISSIPTREILLKLDADFFAGRWARATDRQRQLLALIASLPNADEEFTVQDVVEQSRQRAGKSFSPSHVNQMLAALGDRGLIYKNRHGKYCFAVPLMAQFIRRQPIDLHEVYELFE
jgi:type II secretory pathway predicted ATPase ExeA